MNNDRQKIERLLHIVQEAENSGNLDLMTSILAEDLTVIAPGSPIIQSKRGGVEFLRSWFDAFKIEITYESQGIEIREDLAYEWAIYQQATVDKKSGEKASETGRMLWIYKKYDTEWLQHFIIWNTAE
ncbi:hypothetical protein GCM10023091_28340 [Ravibacter arvi]|uniref:DUF4440 domain-containing protein n=1 Tax=Ravibacter arvi TaxID=2051041 RepID=A0ABP8M2Q2_9BACT